MTLKSTASARDHTDEEFWTAFWATKRAMKEAADAAYRRHGMRDGQQFILGCLWEEDGLTPGQIARRLDLATPTVTKVASRMETAGLLARRAHPSDGRLVQLFLTERGRTMRATIDGESRRLTERALGTLDPEERAQVVRFLNEIRRNVSREQVGLPERGD